MNLTRDRLRSIGWAFVLTICLGLTLGLTFRVNAVKSEVRQLDRRILALRQEKRFLETEFESRASQQQLRALNEIEFGYEAPRAEQYLEGERQLAALGKPRGADAPEPIRVASAADTAPAPQSGLPAMVSPLTGRALAAELQSNSASRPARIANLREHLVHIESRDGAAAGDSRE